MSDILSWGQWQARKYVPSSPPPPSSSSPLPQALLPPRRTTPPPCPHVWLWRQGRSLSPPTFSPFTLTFSRIVDRSLLPPSPRWSSAERTTRLSMSSTSTSHPSSSSHPHCCSELDSSFFLVTVDLWSADGKREMNLVLHPSSSTDRYVSATTAKSKKARTTLPTTASPRIDNHSPSSSHSTPNSAPEPPRPSLDSQVCIMSLPGQIMANLSVSQS